ncbi:flavodoxin-like protein [Mariannaea sp. PMI_226]|nr:flavodoxin-like protein [Mariannaea sp. PMI_226]
MAILVSYATSHGSTREIAERIAQCLSQQLAPVQVDCTPATAAPFLSSSAGKKYKAVVIGSAIHAGRWLGPGRRFLKQNGPYLSSGDPDVPHVWAFSVGMPLTDDDLAKEEASMEKWLHKRVDLRGHKLFRGVLAKEDLPWVMRLIFSCCISEEKTRFGDSRDWSAIEGWANQVGSEIMDQGAC